MQALKKMEKRQKWGVIYSSDSSRRWWWWEDEDWRRDYIGIIPWTLQEEMVTMRWKQNELITNDIQCVKMPKTTGLSEQGVTLVTLGDVEEGMSKLQMKSGTWRSQRSQVHKNNGVTMLTLGDVEENVDGVINMSTGIENDDEMLMQQ